MKICTKCKKQKPKSEFQNNASAKDSKASWCKQCCSVYRSTRKVENASYMRSYWAKNRNKLKEVNSKYRLRHISIWIVYFKKQYGEYPKCQICKKDLEWNLYRKNKETYLETGTSVFFDHKSNGVSIKISPAGWYANHPCNNKNIKIWESCNFGILCNKCNLSLPTKHRKEWLQKALSYTNGE